MTDNIEDYVLTDSLPVNTIAMANRLIEILKEADTNCASALVREERKEQLLKFEKCLWLINQQIYGQLGTIDMSELWTKFSNFMKENTLYKEKKVERQ